MHRLLAAAPVLALLLGSLALGCAKQFQDMRTPSGEFCSDMPVIPAGQVPDREYHRLKPIASDPEARTEAERLESLRKAGCDAGGDAVIEAVNEEVRMPNATYATVSSGTAVIWVRRSNADPTPLTVHPAPGAPGSEEASESEPAEAPTEETAPAEPEPAPPPPPKTSTASPATTTPPAATAPAATTTAKTAPTSTAKTTSTTKSTSTTKTAPAPTSTGKATFLKKK